MTEIENLLNDPHDEAAERYVLAAALQTAGRTLGDGELTEGDFYNPRHRALWSILRRQQVSGDPVEPQAILPAVTATRGLDAAYVAELVGLPVTPAQVGYYARQIRTRAVARAMIAAATRVDQVARRIGDDDDLTAAANTACQMITDAASLATGPTDLGDDLWGAIQDLDAPDDRIPTGWGRLDHLIGGWSPGQLIVVGARPGAGKSLLGVCAALHAAREGNRVLIASVEMSRKEIYHRMLANVARVPHERLVRRKILDTDFDKLTKARRELADLPLHVADDVSTPAGIITRAHAIGRQNGPLGLLIVDYLQLMTAPAEGKVNRQEIVAGFSRSLKLAAKQLNVPVLALAQLNRETEHRQGMPRLSDLRDSGALEQDADIVLLMHRDTEHENHRTELKIAVAKNRHGVTGGLSLHFNGAYQRIQSVTPEDDRTETAA